jgi:alanyl-tRNA synthetase
MGDTGPCGPCSEIFYDHGDRSGAARPAVADEDGDRFIEIWNLVFMQFEQFAEGRRIACPSRRSTPAWGWSASPPSCRASTTTTTPT